MREALSHWQQAKETMVAFLEALIKGIFELFFEVIFEGIFLGGCRRVGALLRWPFYPKLTYQKVLKKKGNIGVGSVAVTLVIIGYLMVV
jgi:hypothetical protein